MEEANYINRQYDEEIIKLIRSILSNSVFEIETYNESLLVTLMNLRGTPIKYERCLRNLPKDYVNWKGED